MKLTVYEIVTNTILTALCRGVVPWRKPWNTVSALPENAISRKTYRGVNILLLSMSPYVDHRWLTFRQVEERGGRVKPGERSTMVVFWKQWEPTEQEEAEESKKRQIPLLRYFQVFNVEQCEGLDVPRLYTGTPEHPNERIERAEVLISSMPNPPQIRFGQSAWYRPSDDLVQIPPLEAFESPDSYYSTLLHELGHSTGHLGRLNRTGVAEMAQFGSGEYSKEELVAELTSAFCCATISLDNSVIEDAASYIQGWLRVLKADPKAVVIAAAQAQKAADYIRGVTFA